MSESKHTPGAVAAAQDIFGRVGDLGISDAEVEQWAQVIDEMTGAPDLLRQRDELLEAATYVLDTLRAAQEDAGAHGHGGMVNYLFEAENRICAAIASAKGEGS